ncbi:MAG: LCP family protein [Eubacteriales bacterium]|nr:LCP family protein [Eubacteriales bacterium]
MEQPNKKKISTLKRVLLLCVIILGIAILVIVGRYLYVMFVNPMGAFTTPPPRATATPSAATLPPEATPTPEPTLSPEEALYQQADMSFMQNKVNILMLGWDQSPEREDEDSEMYRDEKNNYRSDVIMLLTVDFETKTVDLISVPRDTYAPIFNTKGRFKINAAFAKGGSAKGDGFHYAMETVGNLLGVPIDYYAGVDMVGMKAVVDAMGGVDYDVDCTIKLNGRLLEPGYQHLNGQQVLDYCRARKGIIGGVNSDVGRADRQQRMLFSIFEQMKSRDQLVNIPKIYNSVKDYIHTNLNSEQIAAMAVFAMDLDMDDLRRHTLEGEYVNNVYNASFYVLKNDSLAQLINEVFGITIKPNPRYDLNYVKADKAAAAALSYYQGAEYIVSVLAQPAFSSYMNTEQYLLDMQNIQTAEQAVLATAYRGELPVDEEAADAILDQSLDAASIETAQTALIQQMYTLCMQYGLNQSNVDKTMLPKDFFLLLPDPLQQMTPAA